MWIYIYLGVHFRCESRYILSSILTQFSEYLGLDVEDELWLEPWIDFRVMGFFSPDRLLVSLTYIYGLSYWTSRRSVVPSHWSRRRRSLVFKLRDVVKWPHSNGGARDRQEAQDKCTAPKSSMARIWRHASMERTMPENMFLPVCVND